MEEAESLCKNIAIIDQGHIIEQDSMAALLSRLHVETFILNLDTHLENKPELDEFDCRLAEPKILNWISAANNILTMLLRNWQTLVLMY